MSSRIPPDNTLHGRGFARTVDGRYYGPDWLRPTPPPRTRKWPSPGAWLAITTALLVAVIGLTAALPSILAAAIAIGDHFHITAR